MNENFIGRLKEKEDEMAAWLDEAKKTAASMREDAVKRAGAIREHRAGELNEEIKAATAAFEAEAAKDIKAIEEAGAKEAAELESRARPRLKEAVELAKSIIAGRGGALERP